MFITNKRNSRTLPDLQKELNPDINNGLICLMKALALKHCWCPSKVTLASQAVRVASSHIIDEHFWVAPLSPVHLPQVFDVQSLFFYHQSGQIRKRSGGWKSWTEDVYNSLPTNFPRSYCSNIILAVTLGHNDSVHDRFIHGSLMCNPQL